MLQGKAVVASHVRLEPPRRALIVSGPNGGGKTVAITAVAAGVVLIIVPIGVFQWQLVRTAAYYEQHGTGSSIPNELRPAPFRNYDWACLILGAILAFAGLRGSAQT